ncbi:hypothetical protein [Xanthomonas arboricola]|uniref:hypothetical protein n=1 Tax=Xanthomonas arboricola TaxID=56448 RepID=UPI000CC96F41|nr:hypothetical protein [Xanthomonas arboricola]SOT99574.1 hypothetical protein CFBP6762_02221 [Xanthomonas arboricola pv. fragariae]
MNRILIAIAAALLWSGAMFCAGWAWRGDRAETATANGQAVTGKQSLQVEQAARAAEHNQAKAMAAIGDAHEQDREAAKAVPDAVVADLRNGALKLRDGWASCETQRLTEAAAGTRERDAGTQRREEFAGRIVRIGRDADDQLRACQAVVLADRGLPTPRQRGGQSADVVLGAQGSTDLNAVSYVNKPIPVHVPRTWNMNGADNLNDETKYERIMNYSGMAWDPGASAFLPGGIRTPVRDSILAPRDAPPQVGQK